MVTQRTTPGPLRSRISGRDKWIGPISIPISAMFTTFLWSPNVQPQALWGHEYPDILSTFSNRPSRLQKNSWIKVLWSFIGRWQWRSCSSALSAFSAKLGKRQIDRAYQYPDIGNFYNISGHPTPSSLRSRPTRTTIRTYRRHFLTDCHDCENIHDEGYLFRG